MSWTLAAALLMVVDPALFTPVPVQGEARAAWHLEFGVAGPATTTDPQHVGFSLGIGRAGTSRMGVRYQPSETDALGFVHGTVGVRLSQSDRWLVAADLEHAHVWAARRLFRTGGFQFEGHDRRQLSLAVISARASHRRWFGVVDGIEVGGGRMHVRELVAGRVGSTALNARLVPILSSWAPVGMLGITMSHDLFWGFTGDARVRVIGAGHSRGGVVPFAHATVNWEVVRPLFTSSRYGRGYIGITGTHASSSRAVTYYQNGIGLAFRISY